MATKRELAAFLAIYWNGMDIGYMRGYRDGEGGLESPNAPYAKLDPKRVSAKTMKQVRDAFNAAAKEIYIP